MRHLFAFGFIVVVGLIGRSLVADQLRGRYPTWPANLVPLVPIGAWIVLAGWLEETLILGLALLAVVAVSGLFSSAVGHRLASQRRLQTRPAPELPAVYRVADDTDRPIQEVIEAAERAAEGSRTPKPPPFDPDPDLIRYRY